MIHSLQKEELSNREVLENILLLSRLLEEARFDVVEMSLERKRLVKEAVRRNIKKAGPYRLQRKGDETGKLYYKVIEITKPESSA